MSSSLYKCQPPLALSMCRRQNLSVGLQGPDPLGLLLAKHVWSSASGAIHATASAWQSGSDASCDAKGNAQATNSASLLICTTHVKEFGACTYNHVLFAAGAAAFVKKDSLFSAREHFVFFSRKHALSVWFVTKVRRREPKLGGFRQATWQPPLKLLGIFQ